MTCMGKKITAVILCLVFCVLCLASCGKGDQDFVLPISDIATSCDPQIASNDGLQSIANNAFEGLVRLDQNGRVIPGAATSWTISNGGLTYTFHLKPGLKWHLTDDMDDTLGKGYKKTFYNEVTADDFVFGLQRAVAKSTQCPLAFTLYSIQNAEAINKGSMSVSSLGVRALGPYTLQIQLARPDASLLEILTTAPCMPCNRHFFNATNGQYCLSGDLSLCNGPYYISQINTVAATVLLKKNPDYQGSYKSLGSTLKFVYAQDLGGQGDSGEDGAGSRASSDTQATPIDIINSIKTESGISAGVVTKDETTTLPKKFRITPYENQTKALCFNQKSKMGKNARLRMALTYATDTSAINEIDSKPASGLIPSCLETSSGKNYRAQAGRVVLGKPNLKKARQYAGSLTKSSDSSSSDDSDNQALTLNIICLEDDRGNVQALAQNWQKVFGTGFSILIKSYPNQTKLNEALKDGKYDLAYTSILAHDFLAEDFLNQFVGATDDNFIALNDTAFNGYVSSANAANSNAGIAKACKAAEQYLLSKGIIIPVRQETNCLVTLKSTEDIFTTPSGSVFSAFSIPENS